MMQPPILIFVSSLFTSKIFWTQVIALAATILTAAGVHVLDDPATQTQWILYLNIAATMLFRWWFPTGPVSITAPVSVPAPQPVPPGSNVVHVAEARPATTYSIGTVASAEVIPTMPGATVPQPLPARAA